MQKIANLNIYIGTKEEYQGMRTDCFDGKGDL